MKASTCRWCWRCLTLTLPMHLVIVPAHTHLALALTSFTLNHLSPLMPIPFTLLHILARMPTIEPERLKLFDVSSSLSRNNTSWWNAPLLFVYTNSPLLPLVTNNPSHQHGPVSSTIWLPYFGLIPCSAHITRWRRFEKPQNVSTIIPPLVWIEPLWSFFLYG